MLQILSTPKALLGQILLLISISAIFLEPSIRNISVIFVSLISTIFFDILFTYIRSRKLFIPLAGIVTGLIIGLIITPSTNLFQILVICFIAMAIKNFLRVSNRHIFNPAAAGLVLSGIILNLSVAWWGVSLQTLNSLNLERLIPFLIVLLPAYVSMYRLRRYATVLSFWVIYLFITAFQQSSFNLNSLFQSVLNPSLLFFSLVMLPEPMTSPVNLKRQILFGALVAILIPLLSLIVFNNSFTASLFLVDPILVPLLIANLLFFKYR